MSVIFWAISMISGNGQLDELCGFSLNRQRLPQPPWAYAVCHSAQCPRSNNLEHKAAWQQQSAQQHTACTCWSNPSVETQQGLSVLTGSNPPPTYIMLLDLPRLSKPSEHILEEHSWSGSVPHWRYRAQNSPPGTNEGWQLRCNFEEGEPSNNSHTPLAATPASLVTTPVDVKC